MLGHGLLLLPVYGGGSRTPAFLRAEASPLFALHPNLHADPHEALYTQSMVWGVPASSVTRSQWVKCAENHRGTVHTMREMSAYNICFSRLWIQGSGIQSCLANPITSHSASSQTSQHKSHTVLGSWELGWAVSPVPFSVTVHSCCVPTVSKELHL